MAEQKIVLKKYLVVVYGTLIRGGRMALTEEDNPQGLKVCPELYREAVAEWIAEHAG